MININAHASTFCASGCGATMEYVEKPPGINTETCQGAAAQHVAKSPEYVGVGAVGSCANSPSATAPTRPNNIRYLCMRQEAHTQQDAPSMPCSCLCTVGRGGVITRSSMPKRSQSNNWQRIKSETDSNQYMNLKTDNHECI